MIRFQPEPASPGQPCPTCAGRGHKFDAYFDSFTYCPVCNGIATVGVYVIRVRYMDGTTEERNYHTRDCRAAARRARRLARLLGVVRPDTAVESVRVVYLAPERSAFVPCCASCGAALFGRAGQGGDGTEVHIAHVLRVVRRAAAAAAV